MKKFKKIMAILVAALMIAATMVPAWASVTIKITKDDSTYEGDESADSRNFTWYKVFTATYTDDFDGNKTGGGYDNASGMANQLDDDDDYTGVAYFATPAVAAKLGDITNTSTWTRKSGQPWFTLTYVPGSTMWNVKFESTALDTAEEVQAAAKWLKTNAVYETGKTGTLTWDSTNKCWSVTLDDDDKGYYLLESEAGKNLIAATSDIQIKEKNAYTRLSKKQSDEDDASMNTTKRDAAIEDTINYEVSVDIPKTAKKDEKIKVWDVPSNGLSYTANSVAVKSGADGNGATIEDATGADIVTGAAWTKIITLTDDNQAGSTVTFVFSMKVNNEVLTDAERKNTTILQDGRADYTYTSLPKTVEFTTYFAGINKVDSVTKDGLVGVHFTLKEKMGSNAPVPYKVKYDTAGGYYVPDETGSADVVTGTDGKIRIRGLDEDKEYTLTETETLDGYYLHEQVVTLHEYEDIPVGYTKATGSFDSSGNTSYYTKSGDNYTKVDNPDNTAFQAGSYYVVTAGTNTYADASDDKWTVVENVRGTRLPSTGGMGTTVLYIVGGMLVILAGAYLFFSRKKTA